MTLDPTAPLLVDALPAEAKALHAFVMREHDDRAGQLGRAWWAILCDGYQGTGGFMRNVDAVATRDGGPGSADVPRGRSRSTYLTPFRRESPEAFGARADRSAYQNHLAPVVDVYHGHFTRQRPKRESADVATLAWWKDVDGAGHDADEWMDGVTLRAQLHGWCAVLLDRDREADGPARTRATVLDPGELRDWQIGHDKRLDWARVVSEWRERDPATGAEARLVEASIWTRTEWARVRLEYAEGEWSVVARDGARHDLGRVPLAVLRWKSQLDGRALYGLSQVQGVLPLTLALFNNESEYTDHLAGANFALLAIQSDDPAALNNLVVGANGGIRYGEREAAPQFVAPDASVALQYALRSESLTAAIYTAAKMEKPGVAPTGGDVASGVAKGYEFSQTDSALADFARACEAFEFELVAIEAGWRALGDAAQVAATVATTSIAYPKRFDAARIQSDLGVQFAILDDKVRAQFPPEVVRQARLMLARGLYPEASPAVEAAITAEIDAMYARDVAAMGTASTDPVAAARAEAADAIDALPPADPADPLNTATATP